MKELLNDLFQGLYERTIDDNREDFEILYSVISKLGMYLMAKKVINADEFKEIMRLEKLEDRLKDDKDA